jgi:hypothetical protein
MRKGFPRDNRCPRRDLGEHRQGRSVGVALAPALRHRRQIFSAA